MTTEHIRIREIPGGVVEIDRRDQFGRFRPFEGIGGLDSPEHGLEVALNFVFAYFKGRYVIKSLQMEPLDVYLDILDPEELL